jgi:acyl-CoA reductase-like NAD-dependent aldehyde dehydrogenase
MRDEILEPAVEAPARIAGRLVRIGRKMEVRNPFGGALIGVVPACTPEHVDEACRGAQAALDRDDFPQHRRARVLERAAELVRARQEHLARTIALEAGKPIRTARIEAARCIDTLTFSAVESRRLTGEMIPMEASEVGAGRLGFALRVPIGVVAAITPFNFPLNLVAHKIAPAVAAGCPVVVKPARATPLSCFTLVDLLIEAGLPEDWISVLTGSIEEVAEPLVEHSIPRMVTFTGSPAVGWSIVVRAPRKKVSLELGSNAPVIVEPDADLAIVAAAIRVAGFSYAGQSCISAQRILVHRSVHDRLIDALEDEVESLVVGDPLDEATDVGPLISPRENERILRWIEEARAEGAQVTAGGRVEDGILLPTIVDNVPPTASLCTREVFGPVVVVLAYDSFDEALELANNSDFGLHAGVFTNDLGKAMLAARRLRFGGVLVNDVPTRRVDHQPYGGVRESGNTREGPAYTVNEMTELRFVSLPG